MSEEEQALYLRRSAALRDETLARTVLPLLEAIY